MIKKSIVKVFSRNNPNKFWSGFVVGNVTKDCIIFTTAHCLRNTVCEPDSLFGVCFYDSNGLSSKTYDAITRFLKRESEILILSVKLEPESTVPKLSFDREEEWNIKLFDTLFVVSHPSHRPWRATVGRVCSSEYFFDGKEMGYDDRMVVFDHDLKLVIGSSDTALVNENGHVVGLQSGELLHDYKLVSEISLLQARDYSYQNNLPDIPKVQLDWTHVISVPVHPCNIKYAVHVKYLSEVLRNSMQQVGDTQCTLNEVIEEYLKPSASVTLPEPGQVLDKSDLN